ncbi:MAG TPA: MmcQ/YjbR family DNA-binding protein [Candidatus Acidoferrum sp.]|nr:MmcQ/YjbR family DNA-binding protein [Candidatus Acidoferrum sp.]
MARAAALLRLKCSYPKIFRMNVEWLREVCLSYPGATEQIQWGYDLLFKVGGKMFAVTPLEPAPVWLSFKASPENFAELTERQKIIPAPYLARAQWVALETNDALPLNELASLLRESYEMVFAKLPKKTREAISRPGKSAASAMRGSNGLTWKGRSKTGRKKKTVNKKGKRLRGR